MILLVFSLLAYLLLALTSPLMAELGLALHTPDMVVLILVAASAWLRELRLLFFSLFVGLLADAFTPAAPVGLHAERAVLLGYALRMFATADWSRRLLPRLAAVAALTVLSDLLVLVLSAIFDPAFQGYGAILGAAAPHALVSAAALPLVDLPFRALGRRIVPCRETIFYS